MAREQLERARELLQQKQYPQARALLKTIDHPTALKWLAKLDEIAPERPVAPSFNPVSNEIRAANTVESPPRYKPWNPNFIGGMTFFATSFVSGTALSLNWRRLGKPDYLAPTLLLTFALPGLVVLVLLTLMNSATRTGVNAISTFPIAFIVMLSASANLFFIFGVTALQYRGYKAWQKHGDIALQQYKYPVYQYSAIFVGSAVLFALVASVILWSDLEARSTPRTLTSGNVTFSYLPAWEIVDVQQVEGCDDRGIRCIAALSLSPFHFTSLLMVEFSVEEGTTAIDVEKSSWDYLLECSPCAVELDVRNDVMVGSRPAVTRQYTHTEWDGTGERSYVVQTYVVVGNYGYEITVNTPNPGIFRENRYQIDGVVNSIQFIGLSDQT